MLINVGKTQILMRFYKLRLGSKKKNTVALQLVTTASY